MNQPHHFNIRVYYEDTDAGGVVYHAAYLRFAERGRTEALRAAGFEHAKLLREEGIAFAVISLQVDFKSPARLDDLLTVKTRITELTGATASMTQQIWRGEALLADLTVRLACLDRDGKAVRLPVGFRRLFQPQP